MLFKKVVVLTATFLFSIDKANVLIYNVIEIIQQCSEMKGRYELGEEADV